MPPTTANLRQSPRRSNPITCPDLQVISYPALPKPLPCARRPCRYLGRDFRHWRTPDRVEGPLCVTPRLLGVIRILIERSQPLPLNELIRYAFEQHTAELAPDTVETVLHYILERLGNWYDDAGIHISVVRAVLATEAPICLTLTSALRR